MWKFRLRNLTEETAQRASNGLKPRLSGSKVYPLGLYAAAAAAKLLQSCPTLCDPIDGSPPGSPVPGILQARTLEWGAIAFCIDIGLLVLKEMIEKFHKIVEKQDGQV